MTKTILTTCPSCQHSLIATRLTCKNCRLELTNEFPLSPFSQFTNDEVDFITSFLQTEGNLKKMCNLTGKSYPSIKKQLAIINDKLDGKSKASITQPEIVVKELSIYQSDSKAVQSIKKKLNIQNGSAQIALPRGNTFLLYYDEFGNGLMATNLPKNRILTWNAIDYTIELLQSHNGRAVKGNAMKARLGEPLLPLDSVEGYVAFHAYQAKPGESVLRMISTISAVLEWAGLCRNGYGFLELA